MIPIYYLIVPIGQESGHDLPRFPAQSYKAEIKVSAELHSDFTLGILF